MASNPDGSSDISPLRLSSYMKRLASLGARTSSSPTAAGNGWWQRIQHPIRPVHPKSQRGAKVRVKRLFLPHPQRGDIPQPRANDGSAGVSPWVRSAPENPSPVGVRQFNALQLRQFSFSRTDPNLEGRADERTNTTMNIDLGTGFKLFSITIWIPSLFLLCLLSLLQNESSRFYCAWVSDVYSPPNHLPIQLHLIVT